MRALFEVALRKGWAIMAGRLLQFCKVIERRLWGFESALHQFPQLGPEILRKLDERKISVDRLRDMDAKDIGASLCTVRLCVIARGRGQVRASVHVVVTSPGYLLQMCINIINSSHLVLRLLKLCQMLACHAITTKEISLLCVSAVTIHALKRRTLW